MTDVEYDMKDLEMILKIMGLHFRDKEPSIEQKKLMKKTEVMYDEEKAFEDSIDDD